MKQFKILDPSGLKELNKRLRSIPDPRGWKRLTKIWMKLP